MNYERYIALTNARPTDILRTQLCMWSTPAQAIKSKFHCSLLVAIIAKVECLQRIFPFNEVLAKPLLLSIPAHSGMLFLFPVSTSYNCRCCRMWRNTCMVYEHWTERLPLLFLLTSSLLWTAYTYGRPLLYGPWFQSEHDDDSVWI